MTAKKLKPIITKLVLINLHISFDTGRRTMSNLSKTIAKDNDADANMLSTSIKLIPNEKIRTFTTAVSQAREFYKKNSLPWEDGNWRVVPVNRLQQFKDDLDALISKASDEHARCFIANYDALKDAANKKKGKLVVNFPTKKELEESFKIEYNVGAIASTDDIRIVGIDTALRNQIKKDTEKRYVDQISKGLTEQVANISSALESLVERVGEDDQKGKKYTRAMANFKAMLDTTDQLNITNNAALANACKIARDKIANWSPDAIKSSPEVRTAIKGAAEGVRSQLKNVKLSDKEKDN